MKAGVIFTGTGPILILTTYDSFEDGNFKARPQGNQEIHGLRSTRGPGEEKIWSAV